MSEHTLGPWEWWTSNTWRRLRHSDRGVSTNVLMPFPLKDGGADIDVTPADMSLIAAAPELLEMAKKVIEVLDSKELQSVFSFCFAHDYKYDGPVVPMKELRALV